MKMTKLIFAAAVILFVSGCAHNINVQGLGIACPYGAMGYGTFSCVKDSVKVTNTEETTKEGIKTTNSFETGKQTTGYDVELEKSKK